MGEQMYKEKIQGHIYPLKCVPKLHVQYNGQSILHFFPIILRMFKIHDLPTAKKLELLLVS